MALCSAAVTNNANSKLCRIDLVSNDVNIPSTDRMELIGLIVDEYRRGTDGSVERIKSRSRVADSLRTASLTNHVIRNADVSDQQRIVAAGEVVLERYMGRAVLEAAGNGPECFKCQEPITELNDVRIVTVRVDGKPMSAWAHADHAKPNLLTACEVQEIP